MEDIIFIGGGVAASLTVIETLGNLLNNPPAEKLHITVIEKNSEPWTGIPYGARCSVNALTITSVYDFINEQEQPDFFKWLKETKNEWAEWYRQHGGITAARWLKNNLPLIETEAWATVYIPRFLYGRYISEKITKLIKNAVDRGILDLKLVQAEATRLERMNEGHFTIILEYADGSAGRAEARKVVIATGSAPVRSMCAIKNIGAAYINDIYEPSVDRTIQKIKGALETTANETSRNVLIIGSNASSIELLYLIEGLPDVLELINKIVIISTSGALPVYISTEALTKHPIPHLDKVKAEGNYNIKTLSAAAYEDVKLALQNGANMDYVATVMSNTLKLMEPLDEQSKKEFFGIYAIKIRDSFRRSGPEYKGISELLKEQGKVGIIKGKFLDVTTAGDEFLMRYNDTAGDEEKTYPLPFTAIVNCSGSDDLDHSSSGLLNDLINSGLCSMNLSRKGIEVNEHFEAAPNLYVMGPLLGGNMNKLIHFWQLENASRLTYLAPFLAKELLNS